MFICVLRKKEKSIYKRQQFCVAALTGTAFAQSEIASQITDQTQEIEGSGITNDNVVDLTMQTYGYKVVFQDGSGVLKTQYAQNDKDALSGEAIGYREQTNGAGRKVITGISGATATINGSSVNPQT